MDIALRHLEVSTHARSWRNIHGHLSVIVRYSRIVAEVSPGLLFMYLGIGEAILWGVQMSQIFAQKLEFVISKGSLPQDLDLMLSGSGFILFRVVS